MQQQLYGGESHRHLGRWKKASLAGTSLESLDYPLLETQDEWLMHGFSYANYLQELGAKAQSTIYEKSSVDLALKDAFRKMRAFLMNTKGADRRRGNLADVDCSRFRHHAGCRRKLGRSRHHQEEPFRRRGRLRAAFTLCGWGRPRAPGPAFPLARCRD